MPEPTITHADVRLVDGRPRAFHWRGSPYVVTRIERSWPSGADWWRHDRAAQAHTAPPRPTGGPGTTGTDLPHWLVEAVDPGGHVGLYDVRIDTHGTTLVSAHAEAC